MTDKKLYEIYPPNVSGSTHVIARWMMETPHGWVGAWNKEALEHLKPRMCTCGDRPADECEEEWGPDCDLGNNEHYARTFKP